MFHSFLTVWPENCKICKCWQMKGNFIPEVCKEGIVKIPYPPKNFFWEIPPYPAKLHLHHPPGEDQRQIFRVFYDEGAEYIISVWGPPFTQNWPIINTLGQETLIIVRLGQYKKISLLPPRALLSLVIACLGIFPGNFRIFLEKFRGFFGNFKEFSALIMINNWIQLSLTKLTLI